VNSEHVKLIIRPRPKGKAKRYRHCPLFNCLFFQTHACAIGDRTSPSPTRSDALVDEGPASADDSAPVTKQATGKGRKPPECVFTTLLWSFFFLTWHHTHRDSTETSADPNSAEEHSAHSALTRHTGTKPVAKDPKSIPAAVDAQSQVHDAEALELMPVHLRDKLLVEDYADLPHLK
jgi:hypothetical protein